MTKAKDWSKATMGEWAAGIMRAVGEQLAGVSLRLGAIDAKQSLILTSINIAGEKAQEAAKKAQCGNEGHNYSVTVTAHRGPKPCFVAVMKTCQRCEGFARSTFYDTWADRRKMYRFIQDRS